MKIAEMFEVREIMEMDDKDKKIKPLDDNDCVIESKSLNKNKIILRMLRESDQSQGNVFVKLKDEHKDQFPVSKKLLASQKVIGLTLKQFKEFLTEDL